MTSPVQVPSHLLNPVSGDMSDYVVHFTDAQAILGKILGTGCLKASGPFGFSYYRTIKQVAAGHHSVCLSEIPLDQIQRLTHRHGHYGIGFTKDFIRSKQGARVWYLDEGTVQAATMRTQLDALVADADFTHPMWDLTPFVDLVMPSKRFVFDWEREWRVRGDLEFTLADVAFVVTPNGIDELPALEGLYFHPKHELIVAATTQPLEDYVEDLIQQFLQTFENPICLPVDGGEYVWIVDEWQTEEAVDDLFFEVQKTIREELVDYLNSESSSWVRSEELGHIYE
ncbi:abortive infection system antitoxin AbiGi family protein [Rhodococcus sp. NPDC003322]